VIHGRQSSIGGDEQSLRVVELLATIQMPVFLQLREEWLAAYLPAVEIFIPLQNIFHRRVHGAVAGLLEIGNCQSVTGPMILFVVRHRPVRNQLCMAIAVRRMRHAQRLKNIFGRKRRECLPAHPLHDRGQQKKTSVAV
jgi:hypothetical protein